MLNDQTPLSVDRDPDGFLNVHSVFQTIQGEGPFTGYPATFIRLFGCNLQCPFCDTDYTSEKHRLSPSKLVDSLPPRQDLHMRPLVVITGGEPFRQNITPLVLKLLTRGWIVQIESNGVLYPGDDFPWDHPHLTVVISPKTGKIHPETAARADVYKYVLSHDAVAPDGLPETALAHPLGKASTVARPPEGWRGPIYLNPMDAQDEQVNRLNLEAVAHSVLDHERYIMGVQVHKFLGLP